MHKVLHVIGGDSDNSRLAALAKILPGQMRAAAQTILLAEQHLARVLTLRATGQQVRGPEISTARMALARAQRHAEDLQRIYDALPESLKQVRAATAT